MTTRISSTPTTASMSTSLAVTRPSILRLSVLAIALLSDAAAQEVHLEAGAVFQECAECPQMVVIPPGAFNQGFEGGLEERYEGPPRTIRIEYSFAIGRFEVTHAQFRAFVEQSGYEPSPGCFLWDGMGAPFEDAHGWHDPNYGRPPLDNEPVACLNWTHAEAYVKWLAAVTAKPYRLLSESEWEYVARAGRDSTHKYAWGDRERDACNHANVLDRSALRKQPKLTLAPALCDDGFPALAPIGSFRPNPFGVYDMTGNVWEWVQDCYVMPYAEDAPRDGGAYVGGSCDRRSVRGGSWLSTMFWQRPTFRGRDPEDLTSRIFGLRVARDLP